MPLGVSPLDAAKHQGRFWTPLQLRRSAGGLFLFCDTSEIESISATSIVQQWRDMSGRGNHMVRGSSSGPALSRTYAGATDTYAIDFVSGGTEYLLTTTTFDSTAFSPDRQTGIFIFIMRYVSGTVQTKWENGGGSSRVGIETGNRIDWATDTGGKLEGWTEALTSTEFKICSVRRTAGGKTVRINGRQVASDTNTDLLSTGATQAWHIGSDIGGNLSSTCSFKSIIVTANSDPLTEMYLEGYLAWQHGIRLVGSHPFCNVPPAIGG